MLSGTRRKVRNGEESLLSFRSGKSCRGKEFDDEELFTREIRKEGVLVQEIADAET